MSPATTTTTTVTADQAAPSTTILFSPASTATDNSSSPSSRSEPITAERMLRIFGDVIDTSAVTARPSRPGVVSTRENRVDRIGAVVSSPPDSVSDQVFEGYDAEQIRLMAEDCIVLDENDVPIGSATKKACHLLENIEKGLLHRAFSVFLFDQEDRLLLQQRASEKITFPDMWTNTCCSHPLSIPGETGVSFEESVEGVKRAAQRKLEHELGIKPEQVPLDEFIFLTRIHYKAPCDEKWGEHEIDYILIIKPSVPVTLDVNPNEVRDTAFVSQDRLREMFADTSLTFTPWFNLICHSNLFEWWNILQKHGLDVEPINEQVRKLISSSDQSAAAIGFDPAVEKYKPLLTGVCELRRM